jgi:hypothetical protein
MTMFNPQTPYQILREHHDRVRDSLNQYEMQRTADDLNLTPAHRQALARLGDALVEIGTRLQANDAQRELAPRLDRMGNA